MSNPFTIYFAGDLFDHKHLVGNAILAAYIEKCSAGRYRCIVPQNLEQPVGRGIAIRNTDLRMVLECDLGLFNFDGADLDSGTVAEFMYAKSLDVPAVLFRSDLRSRGEQEDRDPWNLMCSFYPRSQKVQFNGMAWYKEIATNNTSLDETIERLYTKIANRLIAALDQVRQEPALPKGDRSQVIALYRWALRFAGGGLETLAEEPGYVERVVAGKIEKGLI
jgi:nucleoside 2-deoxyribosyltransferase